MSRQSKMARKRLARLDAVYDHYEKGKLIGQRHKGPARTEPKHGKVNRLPYDASHVSRRRGGR